MKKHALLTVLVIALLLCCVSCGQGSAGTDAAAGPDAAAEVQAPADQTPDSDPETDAEPAADTADTDTAPETETEAESGDSETSIAPGSAAGLLSLDAGLLTTDEVAVFEGLYGASREELMAALSLSESDIGGDASDSAVLMLVAMRTVAGKECYQVFNLSTSEPEGLYSLEFRTGLETDTEDVSGVVGEIYGDAVAQYGEPTTYEGLNRISQWLETEQAETDTSWVEEWTLSEETICRINLTQADTLSVITIEYRMIYPVP